MITTGILKVSSGVSRLNGTRLARQGAPDPFGEATNFLANRGMGNNDFISVDGTNGFVGSVPVIFIIDAAPVGPAIVGTATATSVNASAKSKKSAKKGDAKKSGVKKSSAKKSGSKKSSAKKSGAKKSASKKSGSKKGGAKKSAGKKSGKGSRKRR